MSDITVYEKPTCTTCRNLFKLLTERGVDFDRVNYHVEGLTRPQIIELLHKIGVGPTAVLRKKEAVYKQLVAGRDLTDDQLIDLMVQYPELLERPIVVRGEHAVLARPVERALELLDD